MLFRGKIETGFTTQKVFPILYLLPFPLVNYMCLDVMGLSTPFKVLDSRIRTVLVYMVNHGIIMRVRDEGDGHKAVQGLYIGFPFVEQSDNKIPGIPDYRFQGLPGLGVSHSGEAADLILAAKALDGLPNLVHLANIK